MRRNRLERVPQGRQENSPARECWACLGGARPSPVGTTESSFVFSVDPTGLDLYTTQPSTSCWAIFLPSLAGLTMLRNLGARLKSPFQHRALRLERSPAPTLLIGVNTLWLQHSFSSLPFFLSFPKGICFSYRQDKGDQKQIPCGNDRKKGNCQYRRLQTRIQGPHQTNCP